MLQKQAWFRWAIGINLMTPAPTPRTRLTHLLGCCGLVFWLSGPSLGSISDRAGTGSAWSPFSPGLCNASVQLHLVWCKRPTLRRLCEDLKLSIEWVCRCAVSATSKWANDSGEKRFKMVLVIVQTSYFYHTLGVRSMSTLLLFL